MTMPSLEIPPLCNGDRLTREEFERIWELHPEIKRAELIDGQVHLEMTVSPAHGEPHANLQTWLGVYRARHPDLQLCDNTTLRLPGEMDLQPDLLLRRREGGLSRHEREAIEGPPELIAEIAASSAAIDLHRKLEIYERSGVPEYIVWVQYQPRLIWHVLDNGRYLNVQPDATGVIESRIFPGLRLDVPALLAGDLAAVLARLG